MLFSLENTQVFEIDLTNYCNAFCGACDRNIRGGNTNPNLRLKHMDEHVWKALITKDNLKYIKEIHFDGNFGDAIMHPKLIEFLEYLADVKTNLIIKLSTNGGARNKLFWKNLAQVLNKFDYHYVQFAIDGLEDTNHIYRRGVLWNKLIENVKVFIEHNGYAQWRTIVFDHNKHQLNKMAETAKTLGFAKFKSYRSRESLIITDTYKDFPNSRITSPTVDEFEKKYKLFYSWNKNKIPLLDHIEGDNYDCPFGKERIVVIDPFGNLWPCCFIQGNQVTKYTEFPYNNYLEKNNIEENNLENILNYFQNDLYSAWKNNTYGICNNCLHKKNKPTQHNV